jgi:peptidoglycan hydrolase-like protein with peptidoglycan-binding domain
VSPAVLLEAFIGAQHMTATQTDIRAGRERTRRRLALALAAGLALAGLSAATPALADYFDGITAYENRDYATAHRELQPLADRGDARAQRLVGLMYRDGLGVRKDAIRAYMWFDLAAQRGQYGAAGLRDELAQRMPPWQVDEAKHMVAGWQPPQSTAGQGAITSEELPQASTYHGNLTRQQIADLQWQLAVHGYDPGGSDGAVGPHTADAIRRYQADAGLQVDGQPSLALLEHLQYTDPPVLNERTQQADVPQYGASSPDIPSYDAESGFEPPLSAEPAPTVGVAPSLLMVYTLTVQQELAHRGYNPGKADGVLGRQTRAAIRDYQDDNDLPVTGDVSLELVNHLRLVTAAAAPR